MKGTVKALIGILVLLAVLLTAADRFGKALAERAVANRLEDELGTRPVVEVGGFPFLTQAVRGSYEDVQVRAGGVTRGSLRVQDFRAELSGLDVPLSDVLDGGVSSAPVDLLTASGYITYPDLAAASGLPLTLAAEGGRVRVSGSLTVLGQVLPVTALSQVVLEAGALLVRAQDLQVGGAPVGPEIVASLAGQLDVRVPVRGLPYGLRLESVTSGPQGVAFTAGAVNIVLGPVDPAAPVDPPTPAPVPAPAPTR